MQSQENVPANSSVRFWVRKNGERQENGEERGSDWSKRRKINLEIESGRKIVRLIVLIERKLFGNI